MRKCEKEKEKEAKARNLIITREIFMKKHNLITLLLAHNLIHHI